jgi:hypothetical protein
MQNRTQPALLQALICQLMTTNHNPFSHYDARVTVTSYALKAINKPVDMHGVRPLEHQFNVRLSGAGLIEEDVNMVNLQHHNNNKLLREIVPRLMKDNGISVFAAKDEVYRIIEKASPRYQGTYAAELLAANILCLDLGNVFEQNQLLAVQAMVSIANVDAAQAFQRVITFPGKEIDATPVKMQAISDLLISIGVDLIAKGYSYEDFRQQISFIRAGQPNLLSGSIEGAVKEIDSLYIDNLFTASFNQKLLRQAEISRVNILFNLDDETYRDAVFAGVDSGNADVLLQAHMAVVNCIRNNSCLTLLSIPAINEAIQKASQAIIARSQEQAVLSYIQSEPVEVLQRLTPSLLRLAAEHLQNNPLAYSVGTAVLLLIIYRNQLANLNPVRPLVGLCNFVYGSFFKAVDANKKDDDLDEQAQQYLLSANAVNC